MTSGEVVAYFEGKGLSKQAAAGIAGNLQQESGLDPNRSGGGLAQWNTSRYDARGKSGQQQLDQIWRELSGPEIGTLHKLQHVHTPQEGAKVFSDLFERPGDPKLANRERYALEAAGVSGGTSPLSKAASAVGDAVGAVAKPFEAVGEGLGATAKLATVVGEWIAEPMKPLKLLGGGVLIYLGLRTLTRTGAGGSVASEVKYQARGVGTLPHRPKPEVKAKLQRKADANYRAAHPKGKPNGSS